MMNLNLSTIFERTNNELDAFEFAQVLGLINFSGHTCSLCAGKMNKERGKTRHCIDARLRCGKRTSRKTISIYTGSIFENVHIPISKLIRCLYLYCSGIAIKI